MSLPSKYRAVVCEKPNAKFEIKEVELRHPDEGEILVKVEACGVCHSDMSNQEGEMGPLSKWPIVPGHELIGTVVEVGRGVTRWKVGDKAGGGWHGGHDNSCKACYSGLYQICENEAVNGINRDGGWAEYCNLRSEAAAHIPDDIDVAEAAPLLCAGVTVFNSMRNMDIQPGETVAIQGLGGLGHLALQYARKMGFRTVALSSSAAKRDFALQLGATEYVDGSKEDHAEALQKLGGAKMIVVTAPNPNIIGGLLGGLKIRGKLLVLAPVGEVPINTVPLVIRGLSVHGWPSGHQGDNEDTIQFAQVHGVKCMIEKFPLDKVQEAVDHMASGKVRFRAVLTM